MKTPSKKVQKAAAPPPVPTHPPTNTLARILVVDDELEEREVSAGILTRAGYRVDTAKDGADAWNALNARSYDLLITDDTMPRVSGLELIGKLRSAHMKLPVILVSGTLPVAELKRQPWLQLNATFSKPLSMDGILAAVGKVLGTANGARVHVEVNITVQPPAKDNGGAPTLAGDPNPPDKLRAK